jgi:CrcB protein
VKIAAIKLMTVALGGALGASLRYVIAAATHEFFGHNFPYGTLMVNILGSLVIGYFLVLIPSQESGIPFLRLLQITGILGGFTTYSAFSIETLELVQNGHLTKAGLNITLTLGFCFVAVWAGFLIARFVHGHQ